MGLSTAARAGILLVSSLLIGIGAVAASVPSGIPEPTREYIGLGLVIIGAIGVALQKAISGDVPTPAKTSP
jgi:hypothetical protein